MAKLLKFELAPDDVSTGGPNHITRIEMFWSPGDVGLGLAASNPEVGNDSVYDWTAISVDVTAHWTGVPAVDQFYWRWHNNTSGNNWDTAHVRNVRIEDSVTGSVVRDGYPPMSGNDYSAQAGQGSAWMLGDDGMWEAMPSEFARHFLPPLPTIGRMAVSRR